jgi:hypothetical protein
MCYTFQNTHKYVKHKQVSVVPPDSDKNSSNNNNSRDENESDANNDDNSIIPLLVDRSKRIGKSLTDDDNADEDVDPDVLVDVDPAIVECEAKILRAAKHVVMARAQWKLFHLEMKQAREDSASKDSSHLLQQSQRLHVFVGDYCQKLELLLSLSG